MWASSLPLISRPIHSQNTITDWWCFQVKMRLHSLIFGLVSACLLLTVRARPKWLQPQHEVAGPAFGSRDYRVYETPTAVYGYTYGGYGPAPTASQSSTSTSSEATSETSGEVTSTTLSYDSKLPYLTVACLMLTHIFSFLEILGSYRVDSSPFCGIFI